MIETLFASCWRTDFSLSHCPLHHHAWSCPPPLRHLDFSLNPRPLSLSFTPTESLPSTINWSAPRHCLLNFVPSSTVHAQARGGRSVSAFGSSKGHCKDPMGNNGVHLRLERKKPRRAHISLSWPTYIAMEWPYGGRRFRGRRGVHCGVQEVQGSWWRGWWMRVPA